MAAAAAGVMAAALREWAAVAARQEAARREALASWEPLLVSLAGLAEQLRAARRLAWGSSPLGAFGELRERLWRKQRGAAEALLEQLGRRREELRALRDAVGTGAASVLRVYEEKAAELGLAETLRRGPRRPSLADVLEGLQDVERYYRHLYPCGEGSPWGVVGAALCACWPYGARRYLESKLLLLSISCDSPEDMEALPQAWKRILERYEEDTVQDVLLKVSLYLDNQ